MFIYKGPVSNNLSKQTERENASLKSTGLCNCLKGLSVTITTAIQTYGIWMLLRNFRVYAAETRKFRGNGQILRLGSMARMAENCGPYPWLSKTTPFLTFCIAFRIVLVGGGRDFKFVDRLIASASLWVTNRLQGAWSGDVNHLNLVGTSHVSGIV